MPRRRGNPKIHNHAYKTNRAIPLTYQLSVKINADMHDALEKLGEKKAEFIRNAIQRALDDLPTEESGLQGLE